MGRAMAAGEAATPEAAAAHAIATENFATGDENVCLSSGKCIIFGKGFMARFPIGTVIGAVLPRCGDGARVPTVYLLSTWPWPSIVPLHMDMGPLSLFSHSHC